MSSDIAAFQAYLAQSKRVVALLGAGLSASSGLGTFRGPGGVWRNRSALSLASPQAFAADPGLVWSFYSARRAAVLEAHPNDGHRALSALASRWGRGGRLLTLSQNVDDLCERAHHPRSGLCKLHGDLMTVRCTSPRCGYEKQDYTNPLTPALGTVPPLSEQSAGEPDQAPIPREDLPHCPQCGSLLRPGVVWFGESLPHDALQRTEAFLDAGVDLLLAIGMSATVWPAAGFIDQVEAMGGRIAIFNPDPSTGRGDQFPGWHFQGDAAEWLPRVLAPALDQSPSD